MECVTEYSKRPPTHCLQFITRCGVAGMTPIAIALTLLPSPRAAKARVHSPMDDIYPEECVDQALSPTPKNCLFENFFNLWVSSPS